MRTTDLVLVMITVTACGDNRASAHDAGTDNNVAIDATSSTPSGDDHIYLRYPGQPGKPRVLVYTFENYFRHVSNISCLTAVSQMRDTRGFTVNVTNHPLGISAKNLADVDVVVFCVTSGSGMSEQGKTDLEAWIRAGGGTVGFHTASATEGFWQFYGDHVGTRFATHAPGLWPATVNLSSTHPITSGIGDLQLTDEWYVFTQPPETIPGAQIVGSVDENTLPADYPAAQKQGYHAIAWTNDRFGGRMFYTSIGHLPETFQDPNIVEMFGRAIEWAAHQR